MRGRRRFLQWLGGIAAGAAALGLRADRKPQATRMSDAAAPVTLFLCGDVMTGRAIDQILPHPSKPDLHEAYMRDARGYLALARQANGDIPHPVALDYIWGDALAELTRRQPALRIVNLETSVTRSDTPWPDKGIHYRMHPDNVGCIAAAGIDCCVLANNHVIDWGRAGLVETLATLHRANIATAGAGVDLDHAQAPAALRLRDGARLLVFAAATEDSGVEADWDATSKRPGVHRLTDLSNDTATRIVALVRRHRRSGDRVLFSLHWGGNWGYAVSRAQRDFAHALIDEAGVDIVHGHSSHHPRAIELHRDRPILYGCGDFINDYEGIEGHEEYRGELGLMYFPTIDAATGRLHAMDLVPTRIRRFRVERARGEDRAWLLARMRREYAHFGTSVASGAGGAFVVR
jgi:poly-gamma-glutamate capsule biosynthesis protein CapA/YwtB (metallophosphatase superfamily)